MDASLAFRRFVASDRFPAQKLETRRTHRTVVPSVRTSARAGIADEDLGFASAHQVRYAHLAALAVEHGLVLASTDSDFARAPGLRFENPLAGNCEVFSPRPALGRDRLRR